MLSIPVEAKGLSIPVEAKGLSIPVEAKGLVILVHDMYFISCLIAIPSRKVSG